jgi:ornithine carbamoyltransferase
MAFNLKGRSLLTLAEYSTEEIELLLDMSAEVKRLKRVGVFPRRLANKNIALVFLKPSCRTRTAFIVAAADEGANAEIFGAEEIRFGIKESVKDVARVLGRMFDGIMFRGFEHAVVEQLARYSGVPVWNGLCDRYHPTQVLADLLTLRENFGALRNVALTYVGDGRNNQAITLLIGAAKMGLDIRILAPAELHPSRDTLEKIKGMINQSGARITVTSDPVQALRGSAAVYADVWVSMGEEHLAESRIRLLKDFKVTTAMMAMTGRSDSIFLHCLPAFHDNTTEFEMKYPGVQDVDDDVFESPHSRVFDLAENRMHTAKALMVATVA